mgnify:CR=1 FL=1
MTFLYVFEQRKYDGRALIVCHSVAFVPTEIWRTVSYRWRKQISRDGSLHIRQTSIIKVDGDWYFKSKDKIRLTKGLYTEFGVPEILEKGKPYPLLWKNSDAQKFRVYCDIVEKQTSCDNIIGSRQLSTPSHLLAVVPGQHYPVLRMRSHQLSFLNDFDLSITNMDGSVPTFGMNSFVITLKLS